jgi:hypothetical protein
MRSDRNPYFFLKKSKDPKIQNMLKMAETLTVAEIQKLDTKPDIRRAMLYVKSIGEQEKSQHLAETLADVMQQKSKPVGSQEFPIWRYQGVSCWVPTHKSSILVEPNEYFLRKQDKIFINHNWVTVSAAGSLLQHAVFVQNGTFERLNILKQTVIQQRHSSLQ